MKTKPLVMSLYKIDNTTALIIVNYLNVSTRCGEVEVSGLKLMFNRLNSLKYHSIGSYDPTIPILQVGEISSETTCKFNTAEELNSFAKALPEAIEKFNKKFKTISESYRDIRLVKLV